MLEPAQILQWEKLYPQGKVFGRGLEPAEGLAEHRQKSMPSGCWGWGPAQWISDL